MTATNTNSGTNSDALVQPNNQNNNLDMMDIDGIVQSTSANGSGVPVASEATSPIDMSMHPSGIVPTLQ